MEPRWTYVVQCELKSTSLKLGSEGKEGAMKQNLGDILWLIDDWIGYTYESASNATGSPSIYLLLLSYWLTYLLLYQFKRVRKELFLYVLLAIAIAVWLNPTQLNRPALEES